MRIYACRYAAPKALSITPPSENFFALNRIRVMLALIGEPPKGLPLLLAIMEHRRLGRLDRLDRLDQLETLRNQRLVPGAGLLDARFSGAAPDLLMLGYLS